MPPDIATAEVTTDTSAPKRGGQTTSSGEVAYKSTLVGTVRINDIINFTANSWGISISDFRSAPSLTGNFQAPTNDDGTTKENGGAKRVQLATGNTSLTPGAYIGAKLTITASENHPEFV